MKLFKLIAPKMLIVNGEPSLCECTDTITCAYCVQSNLFLMEKKQEKKDDVIKSSIRLIRKNGIRKTSRQIGEHEKTIRRWMNSGNIPQKVVEKLAILRT
jgi:hypothetical protein